MDRELHDFVFYGEAAYNNRNWMLVQTSLHSLSLLYVVVIIIIIFGLLYMVNMDGYIYFLGTSYVFNF